MPGRKKWGRGFTLAELLIVVAIIAVLVAIAIPVFSDNVEKSREATDLANVRDAYAEIAYAVNLDVDWYYSPQYVGFGGYGIKVPLKQKKDGWSLDSENLIVGGIRMGDYEWGGHGPIVGGNCYVTYNPDADKIYLYWDSMVTRTSMSFVDDSGPEEGGGSSNPETQANIDTAKRIGSIFQNYLTNGPFENTSLCIEVRANGGFQIWPGGDGAESVDMAAIIQSMKEEGLIVDNGVTFNSSDPYYTAGYRIYVTPDGDTYKTQIRKGVVTERQELG